MTTKCDVAIIGAGPYGLSAAAHLQSIKGLDVRIFGEPMSFWARHMPAGMKLRSPYSGSHFSDPEGQFTLDAYQRDSGNGLGERIPLEHFVDYGMWFQRGLVPNVDTRKVNCVVRNGAGLRLALNDGEELHARRVVVAGGILPFARRPDVFRHVPPGLASHASEFTNPAKFAGKQVAVVGAGQSALESAVLLHEAGADVEVITRSPGVIFAGERQWMHEWPFGPLFYAWPDVGPAGVSHLVARPNLFRRFSRATQDRLAARSIRPMGNHCLKARYVDIVPTTSGSSIVSAVPVGDELELTLDNRAKRRVSHVFLATGYQVDISKYAFLSRELLSSIEHVNGYPTLNRGFESSAPGLHFLGAPAAWSFGPLMRFVAGAGFATGALTRAIRNETRSL
jgi:lysine/ornithine N-monooxygenase